MRYIGNKENLCDKIHYTLLSQQIQGESLFDVFAGTTSVSQYFKHKGYQITSSDFDVLLLCPAKSLYSE